jgi:hypothetical protein
VGGGSQDLERQVIGPVEILEGDERWATVTQRQGRVGDVDGQPSSSLIGVGAVGVGVGQPAADPVADVGQLGSTAQ